MGEATQLCAVLSTRVEEIRSLDPFSQMVRFNALLWTGASHNEAIQRVVRRYTPGKSSHEGRIARADLRAMAVECKKLGWPGESLLDLFIATMIWGYGKSQGGRPYRNTRRALNDERLPQALRDAIRAVEDERLGDMIGRFRIEGYGTPFFTKFLYAVGLAVQGARRPLILDSRVLTAIGNLAPFPTRTRRGKKYQQYVDLLHDCADELGVTPDQLEYFLFLHGNGPLEGTTAAG